MLRLAFYLLILGGLIGGGLWLQSHNGVMRMVWQGYEIEASLLVVAVALVLLLGALLFTLYFLIHLFSIPGRLRRGFDHRGQEKGFIALNEAMLCIAVNDRRHAEKQLRKAQYYLGKDHAAARLCSVQLSHLKGDEKAVAAQLEDMTRHADTRLLGLRGQAKAAITAHQDDAARIAAQEAWKLQQDDRELADLLLGLLVRSKDWTAALDVVEKGRRHRYYTPQYQHHLQAMIHYLRAKDALAEGLEDRGHDRLRLALLRDAAFQPAQSLQGRLLYEAEDRKAFFSWLRKVWAVQPLSRYSDWFMSLYAAESPAKLQKRAEKLVKANPDHVESQLLLARLAMQRGEWDNARNHIKMALSHSASRRIYELLADIEQNDATDEKQAAEWLKRAIRSPRDELWRCKACGTPHDKWQSHCRHCDSFDTLYWQVSDTAGDDETPLTEVVLTAPRAAEPEHVHPSPERAESP